MIEPVDRKIIWIVVFMAVAIFVLGFSLLLFGFISRDWRVLTPSAILTGFLYWPINRILKMRMESIILTTALTLVERLPPEKAAEQMLKVIQMVLDYDQKKITEDH